MPRRANNWKMFFCEPVKIISIITNNFKAVCLAISLVLIGQLLYVFVEEKPTTTAKFDEELKITDLPEVVVCMDPGFNKSALTEYGYNVWYYWKGMIMPKFVGWNGDEYYNTMYY